MVHNFMEQASWTDDPMLQDMWAGLLTSSCTDEGNDDSNLIFSDLLSGLTRLQAKVLKYSCETAEKYVHWGNLIHALPLVVPLETIQQITGESDLQRLDRELDHLRSLELLDPHKGGFDPHITGMANVTPMPLALHMYVRCQGSRLPPNEFWRITARGEPASPTQ